MCMCVYSIHEEIERVGGLEIAAPRPPNDSGALFDIRH